MCVRDLRRGKVVARYPGVVVARNWRRQWSGFGVEWQGIGEFLDAEKRCVPEDLELERTVECGYWRRGEAPRRWRNSEDSRNPGETGS